MGYEGQLRPESTRSMPREPSSATIVPAFGLRLLRRCLGVCANSCPIRWSHTSRRLAFSFPRGSENSFFPLLYVLLRHPKTCSAVGRFKHDRARSSRRRPRSTPSSRGVDNQDGVRPTFKKLVVRRALRSLSTAEAEFAWRAAALPSTASTPSTSARECWALASCAARLRGWVLPLQALGLLHSSTDHFYDAVYLTYCTKTHNCAVTVNLSHAMLPTPRT